MGIHWEVLKLHGTLSRNSQAAKKRNEDFYFFLFFKTGSHYGPQTGLKLTIFLPPPPDLGLHVYAPVPSLRRRSLNDSETGSQPHLLYPRKPLKYSF
jgi:hypothetical protein